MPARAKPDFGASVNTEIKIRQATLDDCDAITALMALSMREILPKYLSREQTERSDASMGIDRELIGDGTYYLVFIGDTLVGCGGWSARRTLYGGDHTNDRDSSMADPATEAAKVRAMYTHPGYLRRGIGQALIKRSEAEAKQAGFSRVELGATAPGLPFYERCGYTVIEDLSKPDEDGVSVPIILMSKAI